MDKQTESREQFEAWMAAKFSRPDLMLRRLPDGGYSSHYIDMRWEAWQASRDSLVVELPNQEAYDDPLSAHDAIQDCAEAVRAIGIRIKGDI